MCECQVVESVLSYLDAAYQPWPRWFAVAFCNVDLLEIIRAVTDYWCVVYPPFEVGQF